MKPPSSSARRSIRRVTVAVLIVVSVAFIAYSLWRPGRDVVDGRNDRGRNGIWLAHGWLGADEWFTTNRKTNEFEKYRSPANVRALAEKLKRLGITDVFPHLCPASPAGQLPPVEPRQSELFPDAFEGFRVIPWIGGQLIAAGAVAVITDSPADAQHSKPFVIRSRATPHPTLSPVEAERVSSPSTTRIAFAPKEGVDGVPVFLAELRQGLPGGGAGSFCVEDEWGTLCAAAY